MKMPVDDLILLQAYARANSEAAFATLVSRHVNLVYSVAWRQTGDPQLAEDITQAVFLILARKAGSLGPPTILSGWLCRTARYASANALTMRRRREQREQEAYMQSLLNEPEPAPEAWRRLAPLLDGALHQLGRKDHDAVVLRFFEGRTFKEVGAALGAGEDAAKMRVSRALEKLRKIFARQGVSSTSALIAGAMSAHSVQAAPAGLAHSVTVVAGAQGAAAGGSILTLSKGALKLMAWTKIKTAILAAAAVLLIAGTTITIENMREHRMYAWEDKNFTFPKIVKETPPQVRILPSKFRFPADFHGAFEDGGDGRLIGIAAGFPTLVQSAFHVSHQDRIIYPPDSPTGAYDYIANLRHGSPAALQKEVKRKLGVSGSFETLDTDVLLLRVKRPNSPNLKRSLGKHPWTEVESDGISDTNILMSAFASQLEEYVSRIPVIDQTGLTNPYEFHLDVPGLLWNVEALKPVLLDQLGLELVPGREPVEKLVLTKNK